MTKRTPSADRIFQRAAWPGATGASARPRKPEHVDRPGTLPELAQPVGNGPRSEQIGRASCRERVYGLV